MSAGDCERLRELGARAGARDRRRRGPGVGARAPRRLPELPGAARAALGGRRRAAAARAGGRAPGGLRGPGRRGDRRPVAPAPAGRGGGGWRCRRRGAGGGGLRRGCRLARARRRPRARRLLPRDARGRQRRVLRRGAARAARAATKVGYVYGYQGRTSWVLAVIYDGVADGRYRLELVTERRPPDCRCARSRSPTGEGSAGAATPVGYEELDRGPPARRRAAARSPTPSCTASARRRAIPLWGMLRWPRRWRPTHPPTTTRCRPRAARSPASRSAPPCTA